MIVYLEEIDHYLERQPQTDYVNLSYKQLLNMLKEEVLTKHKVQNNGEIIYRLKRNYDKKHLNQKLEPMFKEILIQHQQRRKLETELKQLENKVDEVKNELKEFHHPTEPILPETKKINIYQSSR